MDMNELQYFWHMFFGIMILGLTLSFITAAYERIQIRKALHNLRVDLAFIDAKLTPIHYKLGIINMNSPQESVEDE